MMHAHQLFLQAYSVFHILNLNGDTSNVRICLLCMLLPRLVDYGVLVVSGMHVVKQEEIPAVRIDRMCD